MVRFESVLFVNSASSLHEDSASLSSKFPSVKMLDQQLDSYLAGLWEGDGHLVLPSFDEKGFLKNTPALCVTGHSKQAPLFLFLKHKFGGWLRYKRKENAIVWTVTARVDLFNLARLINGKLRSAKLYEFNLLLDYLNKLFPDVLLTKHPVDQSPLGDNAWLAGFIDAEGGFKIRYTKASVNPQTGYKTKERMALSFRLEQSKYHRITNESSEPLMKSIADFFTVTLCTSKHHGLDYWCVEVTSFSRMHTLVSYLSTYPMLSSKRNDFEDFVKAYHLFLAKEHIRVEGRQKILQLKNQMNRKRIFLNWDHLNSKSCPVYDNLIGSTG